jgi:two-component system, OmpR family, KDP operon response regulator KdpE
VKGAKVLIVDDEPQLQRVLKPALKAEGYEVLAAATGREALLAAAQSAPDLIILDLGLPDMDGKEALRRLRVGAATPVIVLSARDRETEKIMAFDLGADDYVEKPFGVGELLARMRAALRRGQGAGAQKRFVAGELCVDYLNRVVTKNGRAVRLTPKEFDLLTYFTRHAGRILTHAEILNAVWGPGHRDDTQYLRVLVGQLRAKIENDPAAPKRVVTEPAIGYRFIADA